MPNNVPPLLLVIALAADVSPTTIYRIAKKIQKGLEIK